MLVLVAVVGPGYAGGAVAGELIVFNDNGGWCWFQDERVIARDNWMLVGSVADASGTDGATRDGNVELVVYDVERGAGSRHVLSPGLKPADDHNAPALLFLPNGGILAVYSQHGDDQLMRWRIASTDDPANWSAEQTTDLGAYVTYSNLFRLAGESGRLYNFYRGRGWDPNIAISEDGGRSWSFFAQLLENPNDPNNRIRPYLKYASDNRETIHFIASESHPQQSVSTSIYHGLLRGGNICLSDGTPIKQIKAGPVDPASLTLVFQGDRDHRAWPSDLELDEAGNPVAVYSVHLTDHDHRYRYARWDGTRWHDHEIAFAGERLYEAEKHYTGLVCIDPDRTNVVYLSTNVDPKTGAPLISRADGKRHYEIFRGVTSDRGASWQWTPITRDSTVDNIRPVVPKWDGKRTAILWLRGVYTTYTDYDLDVVGLIQTGQPATVRTNR